MVFLVKIKMPFVAILHAKNAKTDQMRNIFKREDYEVTALGQGFVHLVHDRRELKGKE